MAMKNIDKELGFFFFFKLIPKFCGSILFLENLFVVPTVSVYLEFPVNLRQIKLINTLNFFKVSVQNITEVRS